MPILEVHKADNRQLQNIANTLAAAKKVVVVTGAGISTNCGIPDFRSEESLYALIQAQHDAVSAGDTERSPQERIPLPTRSHNDVPTTKLPSIPTNIKGKDLFDAQLWKDPTSTSVFYRFIASLRKTIREDVHRTTPTHRFIKTLRDRRKLVRCYTQNIDGLESRLDLSTDLDQGKGNRTRFTKKSLERPNAPARSMPGGDLDGGCEVVQLHGELENLRCTLCLQTCEWKDKDEARLLTGKAPRCHFCTIANEDRRNRGKRSTKVGTLRPNIVLYGEEHPSADALGTITAHDLALSPDVLLILGTSMHVHGLKILVKEFAKAVHARGGGKGKVIFVNRSKPPESVWKGVIDNWVAMDCDEWVAAMRKHRPDIWHIQGELKPRVVKSIGKETTKATSRPLYEADMHEDKENFMSDSSTTPNEKVSVPMVVVSPKKRRPLQEQASLKRHRPLMDHAATFADQLDEPAFGAKPASEQTLLDKQLQLPTPLSSVRRANFETPSRNSLGTFGEEDLPTTPSKKRKADVSVWEGPDTGHRRRQIHGI